MTDYYQAGSFLRCSPISDINLHVQVPRFECPICGNDGWCNSYNYPHLDASEALSKEDLKMLGPKARLKSSSEQLLDIVWKLRRKWNIPVTTATTFGPTEVKVTTRPKVDFFVLINHAGFFCKRPAVERLLKAGVQLDFVTTPSKGKYATEANYVEIVVPVFGHEKLPDGIGFCSECLRYTPGKSFRTMLLEGHIPEPCAANGGWLSWLNFNAPGAAVGELAN